MKKVMEERERGEGRKTDVESSNDKGLGGLKMETIMKRFETVKKQCL
jgi:hypothetical protein